MPLFTAVIIVGTVLVGTPLMYLTGQFGEVSFLDRISNPISKHIEIHESIN